jgi:hypothetical protein
MPDEDDLPPAEWQDERPPPEEQPRRWVPHSSSDGPALHWGSQQPANSGDQESQTQTQNQTGWGRPDANSRGRWGQKPPEKTEDAKAKVEGDAGSQNAAPRDKSWASPKGTPGWREAQRQREGQTRAVVPVRKAAGSGPIQGYHPPETPVEAGQAGNVRKVPEIRVALTATIAELKQAPQPQASSSVPERYALHRKKVSPKLLAALLKRLAIEQSGPVLDVYDKRAGRATLEISDVWIIEVDGPEESDCADGCCVFCPE